MELPISSSATLAYWNAGGGSVNIVGNGTIPSVVSMVDQVNGLAAVQTTLTNQPTYTLSTSGAPSKYNSLNFTTNDFLACDALGKTAGALNSFSIFLAASTATPTATNMDLFTFGRSGADGYTRLFINNSTAAFSDKNDSATVVSGASGASTINSAVHIYGLIVGGGSIKLQLDGTTVASASISGAHSFNQCTIGALRDNGATTNFLTGNIYEIAVYNGVADSVSVNNYFTNKYLNGINRAI